MADFRSNLGDPEAFSGLPYPASPVTASGEDPDELMARLGMGAAPGGASPADRLRAQMGQPAVNPATVMKPAASAVADTPAPAPQPPAAQPAAGASGSQKPAFEPPSWASDDAMQALGAQTEAGRKMMSEAEQMQPDANVPRLQQQMATDVAAAPKPQDYKPGFGTRLVRGLEGAGLGLAEGGIRGMIGGAISPGLVRGGTAYGAPTDAYDVALQANKQKVASDEQALSDAQANFKAAQDLRAAREKGFADAGTAFGKTATEANAAVKNAADAAQLPIKQEQADADMQKALNTSPDGKLKATQAEIDQRTQNADQMRMPPGYTRTRYILTGDIQPARQATAEEINLDRVLGAYRQEHSGQGPKTVADWQGVISAARGGRAAGPSADPKVSAIVADAVGRKDKFLSQYQRQPDGTWVKRGAQVVAGMAQHPGDILTGDQMRTQLEQFRLDANKQLAALGAKMDDQGQVVATNAPAGPPAPAAAPAQSGEKPARVRMKLPNGRTATFPADKVAEAEKLGAVKL